MNLMPTPGSISMVSPAIVKAGKNLSKAPVKSRGRKSMGRNMGLMGTKWVDISKNSSRSRNIKWPSATGTYRAAMCSPPPEKNW